MTLLKLDNITKKFGGLTAVDKFSLEINSGEVIGIVGPNGSGKTTIFNLISGLYCPDEGRLIFNGQDISCFPPYKRTNLGIGRTFQIPRPFSSATVRENVAIGAMFGTSSEKVGVQKALETADYYLKFMGIYEQRDKVSGKLTPVEKKLMEICRALAMKPKLLLLDESMAGMPPNEIDRMINLLNKVREDEGIAIVAMVEHIMRAVVRFAQMVIVVYQGKKLVEASTTEALKDARVVEVYLGSPLDERKDA